MFTFRPKKVFLIDRNMGTVNPLFNNKFYLVYIIISLKSGLTVNIFDILTFLMVLCLFLLQQMEVFPMAYNLWETNIV